MMSKQEPTLKQKHCLKICGMWSSFKWLYHVPSEIVCCIYSVEGGFKHVETQHMALLMRGVQKVCRPTMKEKRYMKLQNFSTMLSRVKMGGWGVIYKNDSNGVHVMKVYNALPSTIAFTLGLSCRSCIRLASHITTPWVFSSSQSFLTSLMSRTMILLGSASCMINMKVIEKVIWTFMRASNFRWSAM